MYLSNLKIKNFRCYGSDEHSADIDFTPGLSAVIGSNDGGKTAIIDALRFALGTSDQDRIWLDDHDFHAGTKEIEIVCTFADLDTSEKATFIEYLTHNVPPSNETRLIVNWHAEDTGELRKGRPYRRIEVKTGLDRNNSKPMLAEDRQLLQATYLRPLRNAEEELSAGRGSRLAQVLQQSDKIKRGDNTFDLTSPLEGKKLSIIGIANLVNKLLSSQVGVDNTRTEIDTHLSNLALSSETLASTIKVNGDNANDEVRLKEILEKLDLKLKGKGKLGLGSDNLLFMACELILLASEEEGVKLLLIEEPEAHLHAQRQLQVMKYLQEQAKEKKIQIIITTHSPNLSSAIDLENLILLKNFSAFSLAKDKTSLSASDYGFLKRFLDATKANLFFAHGVLMVEGDAENILLPAIASLIGRNLTENGVSIVNVGGVGLGRYARIFQRKCPVLGKELGLKVGCITDFDLMPNCGPFIREFKQPWSKDRKWRIKNDIGDMSALEARRVKKATDLDGQGVKTFISDHWTLEYDLALGPLGEKGNYTGGIRQYMFQAIYLADLDEKISANKITKADALAAADAEYNALILTSAAEHDSSLEEVIACKIYKKFDEQISKPIAAQYLAEILNSAITENKLTAEDLEAKLPHYLIDAISYVTIKKSAVAAAQCPVSEAGSNTPAEALVL